MTLTEERIQRLRTFGLAEYPARAYLALLELGASEARDVSRLSKVPIAKVYQTLDQLQDMGLVEVLPEARKVYVPVDFSLYLERLRNQHREAIRQLDRESGEVLELFQVIGGATIGDRGRYTIVRGRDVVLDRLASVVEGATREVLLAVTVGDLQRGHEGRAGGALAAAKASGCAMRFLAPILPETLDDATELSTLGEVRCRDFDLGAPGGTVSFGVADDTHAWIVQHVPDDASTTRGKDIGLFTNHEAVVHAIRGLLEPHWSNSPGIEARREEFLHGRPIGWLRHLTTLEQTSAAHQDAAGRGFATLRAALGDVHAKTPLAPALVEALRAPGASSRRLLLHVRDASAVESVQRLVADAEGLQARHVHDPALARFVVYDDRETVFSLNRSILPTFGPETLDRHAEFSIHTNEPAAVHTLSDAFDHLWTKAIPLEQRIAELTAPPMALPQTIDAGELVDGVPLPLVVADLEGRPLLWNASAEALLGLSGDALREARLPDLFAEADAVAQAFAEAARQPGPRVLRPLTPRSAAAPRDPAPEVLLAPLGPAQGTPTSLLVTFHDVSEQRRLERMIRSLERDYAALMQETAVGLLLLDEQGSILSANEATASLTGYREEELVGNDFHERFKHRSAEGTLCPPEACPILMAARLGSEQMTRGDTLTSATGARIILELSSRPVRNENGTRCALVSLKGLPEARPL